MQQLPSRTTAASTQQVGSSNSRQNEYNTSKGSGSNGEKNEQKSNLVASSDNKTCFNHPSSSGQENKTGSSDDKAEQQQDSKEVKNWQKTVLKKWFVAHMDFPYLNPNLKRKLAEKSGLSQGYVANWFMNVRKRIW